MIDETQYKHLLSTHGLVGNDLDITVALKTHAIVRSLKKDMSDTVKAEVALGLLTIDQAVQQLHSDGFTQPEIEKLQASFKLEKRKATKIPDLGLLTRIAKAGMIDPTQYLAGVQALGYSTPWDQLIVDFELKATNAGSSTTTAGSSTTPTG